MTDKITPTAIEKAPVEIKDGMVQLNNIESAYRYAQYVVKSGLAPKSFDTPEKVMIALQQGAELGLKPMQSLQFIGVVNGRPALYGKGSAAVVMNSGVVEIFEEGFTGKIENGDLEAWCKVKRKDMATIRTERFTMEDAKKAGLWGKNTWVQYPKDMLMYKARSRAFTLFSDVLAGLPILEDIMEVPAERTPLIPKADGPPSRTPGKPDPLLETLKIQEAEIIPAGPPIIEDGAVGQVLVVVPYQDPEPEDEITPTPKPEKELVPANSGNKLTLDYAEAIKNALTKKELNAIYIGINEAFSDDRLTQGQYADLNTIVVAKNKTLKK